MAEAHRTRRVRDDDAEVVRLVDEIKQLADSFVRDHYDRGDVKLLSRALREWADSFKLLEKFREYRKISVFGSARTSPTHPCYQMASEFGKAMADAGFMVITGAGPGIMEAGHHGAGPQMSIGFNIVLPFEQEANPFIAKNEKLVSLNYFFTRKLLFLKEASAVALFPGGFGTLDEGFEALTMMQTGKCPIIPVVMLDVPGSTYWEAFEEYVHRHLYEEGMISQEDLYLFRICHSVQDAVNEVTQFYRIYHSQRYVRNELVLRLRHQISDELFEKLSRDFTDILIPGRTMQRGEAHAHESNEPQTAGLARLYIPFDRRSHGRLRCLIDTINREGGDGGLKGQ